MTSLTKLTRRTFGVQTWRQVAYGMVSAPVGLAAVALTLVGGHRRAAALQRRPVHSLLGVPSTADAGERPLGTLAYAVLSIPFGLVGLWLAMMIGPNTVRILLYGFFDSDGYADAWGGPTLAGAWAVHLVGWLLVLPVALWMVRGLAALQRELAGSLLGGRRLPVLAGAGSVAVLAAAAVFLTAWVHQA
jgi:hypothetical protein